VKGHGEKFGRKKEQAIAALLSNPTIEEAAKAAGIGSATLWRWLQDAGFKAEYRRARREAMEQAAAQLQQASSAAVRALREVVEDTNGPSSARVMAARNVLDFGLKAIELEDLEERISALEKTAAQNDGATSTKKGNSF
jgi:DNA-binding MurR/RpiR family transcriptional regulator